jgi:hypothetical protein
LTHVHYHIITSLPAVRADSVSVNRIKDLVICWDAFTEADEMSDEMKTLADYGITGSKHDNEAEPVNIFYDFKPVIMMSHCY